MKTYNTPEECIKDNGEHAWKPIIDTSGISCAVYHPDGYCSWNDKKEKCYHCPATRTYTRKQPEIWEWIDSTPKK